jgi:antitoxin VapB
MFVRMSHRAKLFSHGGSQALRLPRECRLAGTEVRVTRIGARLIVEPLEGVANPAWAEIDALGDGPFMPDGREQPVAEDRPALP